MIKFPTNNCQKGKSIGNFGARQEWLESISWIKQPTGKPWGSLVKGLPSATLKFSLHNCLWAVMNITGMTMSSAHTHRLGDRKSIYIFIYISKLTPATWLHRCITQRNPFESLTSGEMIRKCTKVNGAIHIKGLIPMIWMEDNHEANQGRSYKLFCLVIYAVHLLPVERVSWSGM